MELADYLERIGFRADPQPEYKVLCDLLAAHVCSIPFENIDVQLGRKLTTDITAAYEKIVGHGRGGWCYEQNGLFGWALMQTGFDVTRVAASVMKHVCGDVASSNHLCLLVNCRDSPKTYLVDAGFGGSMLEPIEFKESEVFQEPFRLGLRRLDNGSWRFWENAGDGEFSFDFLPEPADEAAMSKRCDFLQTDPSSGFVKNLVAQKRSRYGHVSLRGRVYSTARKEGIETRLINSAGELVSTLASRFNLDIPEAADLWPRIVARHSEVQREQS